MPKSIETPLTLSPGDVSAVIQMAWEDRTTFETIFERTGVTDSVRVLLKCGAPECAAG
jgi:hypothetical protein